MIALELSAYTKQQNKKKHMAPALQPQVWGLLENYVTRLVIAVDNFVSPNL